jgi:hypothetical protein
MCTFNTEQVECILSSCFDCAGPLLKYSVSYLIVIAEIRNSTSGYVVRAFSSLPQRSPNNCEEFNQVEILNISEFDLLIENYVAIQNAAQLSLPPGFL